MRFSAGGRCASRNRPDALLPAGKTRDTQNTLTMSDQRPFSEKIIDYNRQLDFHGALPPGVRVMNPYRDNENAFEVSSAFYRKYYADTRPRHLVMGINPGRFGAGQTGIPFTDTVRLRERCGITGYTGPETRELSSPPSSMTSSTNTAARNASTDNATSTPCCPWGWWPWGATGAR